MDQKAMRQSMKRTKKDMDKSKKSTVGADFKLSLKNLMESLEEFP